MRTAWLTGAGRFELRELELGPPGPRDVLLAVHGCAVCGSNLHDWHHPGKGVLATAGAIGHEISATVVEAGNDVTSLRPGELVVVDPSAANACGTCAACRDGAGWFCSSKQPIATYGFADHMLVPAVSVYPVPRGITPTVAALAEPIACGVHAIRHSWTASRSRRLDGQNVVVIGAGMLGLAALMAAKWFGAGSVSVVARHAHQVAAAEALGADAIIDPSSYELAATLRRLRPDVVVEAVGGRADTLELATNVVGWRGEVVCLGAFEHPQQIEPGRLINREVRLFFAICYAALDGVHDFEVALELMSSGRFPLEGLVTHQFPLEEIETAFTVAGDKSTGATRVLVTG